MRTLTFRYLGIVRARPFPYTPHQLYGLIMLPLDADGSLPIQSP